MSALSGCGTTAKREAQTSERRAAAPPASSSSSPSPSWRPGQQSGRGGYYLDDGPGDNPPANLDAIPDAVPRPEALRRAANRPYEVMGKSYVPDTGLKTYKARGLASWYGRRYHGKQTSSGEIYDMYAMSAAHTTLPIPSYARVTNPKNGRSVVVRINDRGPFHSDRIIDLSYTAAYKLGVLAGVTLVEVESALPGAEPEIMMATAPIVADPGTPAPPEFRAPAPAEPKASPPGELDLEILTARAALEPIVVPPLTPQAADAGGIFLQLGAFGGQDNAENFMAKMKADLDWLAGSLSIFPKDGLYRVHAGPYANRNDAQQMAARISQALGLKPVIFSR